MKEVPVWEKTTLTLEEAAAYTGIGENRLRDITNDEQNLVLWWEPNGSSSAGRWRSTSTGPIPCEMAGIRGFGVVYSGVSHQSFL